MKIFENEKHLPNIDNFSSISYCLIKPREEVIPLDKPDFYPAKASLEDWDLFHFDSILASSTWNGNDDIFLPEELWKARSSIVHKPLNVEHDDSEIIGHVYNSYVLVDDKLYEGKDCPEESFDVCTSSVIYKMKDDEELQKELDNLIDKITAKKLYVSMECLFPSFDYGFQDSKGNYKVVARDKDTSHLSEYLRAYGGNGVYNNSRIGRVLRSITFSAHGIVDTPANKRSHILFSSASIKEINMSQELERKNAELTEQIGKLEKQIASADVEKLQKELEDTRTENQELAKANQELTDSLENVETQKSEISELYEKLKEKSEASETELKEIKETIEKEKAEAKLNQRINALKDAGLDEEAAKAKAEKFNKLDDEQFDEMVSLYKGQNEEEEVDEEVELEETEASLEEDLEEDEEEDIVHEEDDEEVPLSVSIASIISDKYKEN